MCRVRRPCPKDRIATIESAWGSAVRVIDDGEVCCDRILFEIGLMESVERLGTELGNHERMEVQCAIVTTLSIRTTAGPSLDHMNNNNSLLRRQLSPTSSAVLANAAFLCSRTDRSEHLRTVVSSQGPPFFGSFSQSRPFPRVLYTSK